MKRKSYITIRTFSFTRNLMVAVTFQIKPLLNIWSIPRNFNENASWFPKLKERLSEIRWQEDIRISFDNVKTTVRKMTNWKAPGTDFVQGYWFKRFSTLHSRLTEQLQTCVVEGNVPTWMTKRKTTLIQKDQEKGNAANIYCPIAYLTPCARC